MRHAPDRPPRHPRLGSTEFPEPARRPALAPTIVALALASALVTSTPGPANARSATEPAVRWTRIAPGVEAALRPRPARFDDGNSIRVTTAEGVLVVDPPMDVDVAAEWIRRTREEGRTVRWILATHWHSDHHQSADLLLEAFPGATFLGHQILRSAIPERVEAERDQRLARLREQIPAAKAALAKGQGLSGQDLDAEQIEAQRQAIGRAEEWIVANESLTFPVPSLGVDGDAVIDLGGTVLELRAFQAHTEGDLVVRIPALGIALTGDLLDELPFVGHGSPRAWLRALDEIEGWPVQTFVPGHGDPFGKEHLRAVRAFLKTVVDLVDAARAAGESEEALAARAADDPALLAHRARLATDAAAERFFDGTLADAIRAAWNEPVPIP